MDKDTMGYFQKRQSFKACTNCYGEVDNWHLYKGYYWCDGCNYKKTYKRLIKKGLIEKRQNGLRN